jgi:three-Cys-motif partner protein
MFAERFRGIPGHPYEQGFDLRLVPEKLSEPLLWATPKMVFVNSMSDLFQEGVPKEYIFAVVRVMVMTPWHTFQVLTKRPERMQSLLRDELSFAAQAPHIWWGVSVEDKRYGVPRIATLQATAVCTRFLSVEPLLEDLGQINLTGIHWVIVGGESGRGARPIRTEWVESVRDQCARADVPFFFKQWGGVQKNRTGRLLNGRTYDEYPPIVSAPMPDITSRRLLAQESERMTISWRESAMKSTRVSTPSRRKQSRGNKSVDNTASPLVEPCLFDWPEEGYPEPALKRPSDPVWTENKAKFIERYLYYFVLVTKHGTYIDGFAGPQRLEDTDRWSAKLVLGSEPRRLRHFYLYDVKPKSVKALQALKAEHADRDIQVYKGDFNVLIYDLLSSGVIKQSEAAFCLLDQRTFECHWSTLTALAQYKTAGHKIELFYFLPNSWLHRAIAAQKSNTKPINVWWGGDGWVAWRDMPAYPRLEFFLERFKTELGYRSVKPWPIYERQDGGNIMYYMIHATDHPVAPELMLRAYQKAVKPKESYEQLSMELKEQNLI